MACPTCGATQNVHGDCLVCDAPFGAPRARTVYVRPALATREPETDVAAAVAALAARRPASAVEAHLAALPASYLRRHAPEAIGRHLALIERAAGGTAIEHARTCGIDRITVVTRDRSGLLELLAGTLTVRCVSIAAATAYTRADGVVIDVIDVVPHHAAAGDERYWREVCDDLARALAGERSPDQAVAAGDRARADATERPQAPTTVYVHNVADERFSKVEVNATDRPGLLYAITRAMREQALNVHLAEVETVGALAVDSFYVVDGAGRRLEDPAAIARLRERVLDNITALAGA